MAIYERRPIKQLIITIRGKRNKGRKESRWTGGQGPDRSFIRIKISHRRRPGHLLASSERRVSSTASRDFCHYTDMGRAGGIISPAPRAAKSNVHARLISELQPAWIKAEWSAALLRSRPRSFPLCQGEISRERRRLDASTDFSIRNVPRFPLSRPLRPCECVRRASAWRHNGLHNGGQFLNRSIDDRLPTHIQDD